MLVKDLLLIIIKLFFNNAFVTDFQTNLVLSYCENVLHYVP